MQSKPALAAIRWIAPAVLALQAQAKGLIFSTQCRQDGLVEHRGTRHDVDLRLHRQFDVVIGRDRIDQHLEFETVLAKGLNAHAGRTLAAVTEAHQDLVALAQKAAHHLDIKRLVPRSNIAFHVVLDVQHRAVGGFDGDVVRRPGIVELRAAHVGREAVDDFQRTGIVDAEIARGISQGEFLEGSGFEFSAGLDHGGAHLFG